MKWYELGVIALSIALGAGCAWFKGGGGAAVVDAGACIAQDAIAGKPIAQIAIDCGTDVGAVIASLLASADPGVVGSPAALEAMRARRALMYDAGVYRDAGF